MKKLTIDQFTTKAKEIHGDCYDYSNSVYLNTRTKLSIFCPVHNLSFDQRPQDHLAGKGCPYCGHFTE